MMVDLIRLLAEKWRDVDRFDKCLERNFNILADGLGTWLRKRVELRMNPKY